MAQLPDPEQIRRLIMRMRQSQDKFGEFEFQKFLLKRMVSCNHAWDLDVFLLI